MQSIAPDKRLRLLFNNAIEQAMIMIDRQGVIVE
jgi:hypothetical protein